MLTILTDPQSGAHLMVKYEEERDANILRMRRIGHCDWDLVTNVMVWSAGLYSIFGRNPYDGDANFCLRFVEWFHPDDRAPAQNLIWLALESRQLQEAPVPHCLCHGRDTEAQCVPILRSVSLPSTCQKVKISLSWELPQKPSS